MRKIVLLIACLLVVPVIAYADMNKPPELNSVIHSDTAYGQGAYKKLWVKAYDASLWTDAPKWSMQTTFALSLRYNMHFSAEDIVDRSIQEMQHVGRMSDDEKDAYTDQLSKIFPEVHEGDVITSLFTPGKGVNFYYNGKPIGEITDVKFAKHFMDIWLSPKTSAPDLRKQLIKANS